MDDAKKKQCLDLADFLTQAMRDMPDVAPAGVEFHGRFNLHTMDFFPFQEQDVLGGRCFVDGVLIRRVWFADTEMGIVRSYADLEGGDPKDFPGREVERLPNGPLSETLRGRVQIFGAQAVTGIIPGIVTGFISHGRN